MRDPIVEEAVEAAGGPAKVGRELGISSQAVSKWKRIPVERAREVAKMSGIPLERLRPDVWQPQPAGAAE